MPVEDLPTDLDGSFTDLAIKVAMLESAVEKERKSIVKRFGMWGGLMALVISLLTGSFTLYEKLVLRPEQQRAATGVELRKIIGRMAELNSKLTDASLANDVIKFNTISMNVNAEKSTLLSRADKIVASVKSEATFADFIALSYEFLNFGNVERALFYADAAGQSAKTPQFKGEALKHRARALFSPGPLQDVEAARDHFEQSLETYKKSGTLGIVNVVMHIYADWIFFESLVVGCPSARTRYKALMTEMVGLNASPVFIATANKFIANGLQQNTKCASIVAMAK